MENKQKIHSLCALLCLFVVVFDQAVKWSVLAFIPQNTVINVFPGFNLIVTFNTGTSFNLLSPNSVFEHYVIIAISIMCILFLIYVFFKFKAFNEKIFCGLLIGGAIGNLLDRFFHGAVVDFIDVYYKDWHWPAFNFADAFISSSVILLMAYNMFSKNVR
ncbi:MAG: signal peptidase II [Holosporales bacterium]|nr:signal peptidase II [Holosporales bacterium]